MDKYQCYHRWKATKQHLCENSWSAPFGGCWRKEKAWELLWITLYPHHISLSAVLWVRASANCFIPFTVNWLLINLQTNTQRRWVSDNQCLTRVCPWWHHVSQYRVCSCMHVFFTRGGLNLCSLGPTQPSVELHHQSTHSAPTYNSTDTYVYSESSSVRSVKITELKLGDLPTRISWGRCSLSVLLPGTSHLQMWCHWLRG